MHRKDCSRRILYAVFEKTLQTDKGKAIVRKHISDFDAQEISEHHKYSLQATWAVMEAASLLSHTICVGGRWVLKRSTHSFVLYWMDHIRKYDSLSPT